MATPFDLVILGSGSTAFAAALRAQELGKTALMIEERTTGGTCVNRGCLPSKNLIEAARLLYDARHPRYPGIEPTNPRLDFRQLVAQKDDVVREYRQKKYESLTGGQFRIEKGHVEFVDEMTVAVDGQRFSGDSRQVDPETDGRRTARFSRSLQTEERHRVDGGASALASSSDVCRLRV